ncbi:Crp/Fnr family transcriptional regulator [Marinicellulosiphila megalodicopiae]|uniref:Crp/Fnr family transcriptional regulator n=1 Tax=Marinicellulosiphila megalodicopiae TaxID=2724896 RepID=UPI003BB08793
MDQFDEIQLTQEEQSEFEKLQTIKYYKKGEVLLNQNQPLDRYFYVINGCVRSYRLIDDQEVTMEFYTKGQSVLPAVINKNIRSSCYVVCLEDSELGVVDQKMEDTVFRQFPRLKQVCLSTSETLLLDQQREHLRWKSSTLEQRYIHLLKTRADLLNRVPHYQIAQYLGVKPESLSRLRKKLDDKGVSYI